MQEIAIFGSIFGANQQAKISSYNQQIIHLNGSYRMQSKPSIAIIGQLISEWPPLRHSGPSFYPIFTRFHHSKPIAMEKSNGAQMDLSLAAHQCKVRRGFSLIWAKIAQPPNNAWVVTFRDDPPSWLRRCFKLLYVLLEFGVQASGFFLKFERFRVFFFGIQHLG